MKIFNTKYALTLGILEQDAQPCGKDMVQVGPLQYLHGYEREWHLKKETAIDRAEFMRESKIASLEKQLAKLKALKF